MKFSSLMLASWTVYKKAVTLYELGELSASDFLEAHAKWNTQVIAFEQECSAASNYGAF